MSYVPAVSFQAVVAHHPQNVGQQGMGIGRRDAVPQTQIGVIDTFLCVQGADKDVPCQSFQLGAVGFLKGRNGLRD